MWPTDPAAAAAVDAAAAAFKAPPADPVQQQQQQQHRQQQQQLSRGWSFGRRHKRHEWELCFSRVPVRLSGRRKVSVDGLRLAVPDNAEHLLEGTCCH
jgi:hypothetical protein